MMSAFDDLLQEDGVVAPASAEANSANAESEC
jgi:hypothetical protein